VAAFGAPDPQAGTERLVVVAETRQDAPAQRERIRALIVERVVDALGVPPDIVVVTGPGTVLKTSSGKIRRSATRTAYVRGTLAAKRRSPRRQWARLVAAGVPAYLGRLAGRARSMVFAAWVGILLLLTLPPLWILVSVLPGARAVARVTQLWCRGILALAGCRLVVAGLDHLPAAGGIVLAANHSSYVDTVALLATLPLEVRFVAKKELLRTPIVRTVIRKVGHLTVDRVDISRSVADAERVTATLRGGAPLLVFPEGTFLGQPGLLPFRLGAFKAAIETGCPVVPVTIHGTRDVLPADTWLPHRGPIEVRIGLPIAAAGSEWRDMVQLRDRVRAEIARSLDDRRAGTEAA
jgi:1-acyl-sn-glycerol-3-phosphate acyltransferase